MQTLPPKRQSGGILEKHWSKVPSRFFYPGLLFMTISMLRYPMVRLLVLRTVAAQGGYAPSQLWYDESMTHLWHTDMVKMGKETHRRVDRLATSFLVTFCLTEDERTALHCLVCMWRMLGSAELGLHTVTNDRSAPVTVRIPPFAMCKHCHKCHGIPDTSSFVHLPLDETMVARYLGYVDTVSAGLRRIAASMGLRYADLL